MKRLVFAFLLIALSLPLAACPTTPPSLTPDAEAAFQATRIVKVLDVARDAAIGANNVDPVTFSTNSTRSVIAWHRAAIKTIQAVPSGWKPTVKAGIYTLTCLPVSAQPCTPQINQAEVNRLAPYINLVLVVVEEIK